MKIAVFCGSSIGNNTYFKEQAYKLGKEFAKLGITLIYGGASSGIMGELASSTLANNGQVIGVMPKALQKKEITNKNLSELHIVETMHERKKLMMDFADGFIVFPGGIGTMEEFFEVFTWNTIGIINKPCILLNIDGYYDLLIQFFYKMEKEGFLKSAVREKLLIKESLDDAITAIINNI
ncbi:MAG: TIGR00730 family Rossman fold protein [Kurthia sp.]|nr:TIGR00730 family Rossman fold protein [Candidatus Kurthia equi]